MVWVIWCILVVVVESILGWNFVPLNTTNDEVTILHVTTYYMRAFISIQSDLEDIRSELSLLKVIKN